MIRRRFARWILAALLVMTFGCAARAVYVVEAPPEPRVEVKPTAPGPRAVWVSGHWKWNGRKYVWKAGHWERKAKGTWVPGHWDKRSRGWVWVPGHWQR